MKDLDEQSRRYAWIQLESTFLSVPVKLVALDCEPMSIPTGFCAVVSAQEAS